MSEDPIRTQKNSFPKEIRITSKRQMDLLFSSGESFIAYPLRIVFVPRDKTPGKEVDVVVSVSKRYFKLAVKRNRVKRLIRENFRQRRHELEDVLESQPVSLSVAFLFLKNELPDYAEINKAMAKAIHLLKSKYSSDE